MYSTYFVSFLKLILIQIVTCNMLLIQFYTYLSVYLYTFRIMKHKYQLKLNKDISLCIISSIYFLYVDYL